MSFASGDALLGVFISRHSSIQQHQMSLESLSWYLYGMGMPRLPLALLVPPRCTVVCPEKHRKFILLSDGVFLSSRFEQCSCFVQLIHCRELHRLVRFGFIVIMHLQFIPCIYRSSISHSEVFLCVKQSSVLESSVSF